MTIELKPEQEQLLFEAVRSGLAQTADEAVDRAFDTLRDRLMLAASGRDTAEAIRRLASFGKRHGLSLGGSTVKDLLRESRP